MRTADLFAGVGGVRLAFERAGFNTVFANDFEPACKHTYDLNFIKTKLFVEDINKIRFSDLPEFDVLLAGFPCQPFSIAGYRKGFRDTGRGELFFRIIDILKARRPKAVFLENVKNLRTHSNGKTFYVIKRELESLGYYVKDKILNSAEYGGIPQNRERVFIVGFLDKRVADNFEFPTKIDLKKSFRDFLERQVDGRYYYKGKPLYDKLKKEVNDSNTVYQWRRKYVRANKKGLVPTLTANMGEGGHNVPIIKDSIGIRKLTPKECFMIQGFPRNFRLPKLSDSKLYKQAGNSIPVPVVERVAKNMMSAFKKAESIQNDL
ncbi:MAG: DNA cytosine methyltransferase [Candidatus Woesearchaeota archaeon]|nr:DNA cytosine methyltransferase [Candidatus Woesearchaeota archaeon]